MPNVPHYDEEIFDFIKEFIEENRYPPSIRDILEGTNAASTSTVRYSLERLRDKKRITFQPLIARSIVILD